MGKMACLLVATSCARFDNVLQLESCCCRFCNRERSMSAYQISIHKCIAGVFRSASCEKAEDEIYRSLIEEFKMKQEDGGIS